MCDAGDEHEEVHIARMFLQHRRLNPRGETLVCAHLEFTPKVVVHRVTLNRQKLAGGTVHLNDRGAGHDGDTFCRASFGRIRRLHFPHNVVRVDKGHKHVLRTLSTA